MVTTTRWILGLARRRPGSLLGAAASIALAVAFITSLGSFVSTSRASLSARAAAAVSVDWQVQVTPQGTPAEVRAALQSVPEVSAVLPVSYAKLPGLTSTSAQGTRTTGSAYVVSLPPGYAAAAPAQVRYLLGARTGVLLQQQTASNLAAGVGSTVTVTTADGSRRALHVDGVLDLPQADSFFQVVGAPPGAGATAPPDNVLAIPAGTFASLTRGASVVHQFHVLLRHDRLPHDPTAAAAVVAGRALHYEAAVAGGALVGDNLGAALSGAREDALYAQLLFYLLGVPGFCLAAVVASLVVALRGERRRREIALLRLRGASPLVLLGLAGSETALTTALGIAAGIPLALLAIALALPRGSVLSTGWTIAGAVTGVLLGAATQLGPAVRAVLRPRAEAVSPATAAVLSTRSPWPLRLGLDYLLLTASAVVTYLASRNGYQVVVVPEGIPVSAVNYAALLAPALAWPGLALLVWRISAAVLARQSGRWSRSGNGTAPELVAAAVRRRRRVIARGAAGLGVALGLAASTAIFTSTYNEQSRIDVALTVGADVAVSEPPGATVGPQHAAALSSVPGVRKVEPLQHRLAYVGPDLQDLYGVRPASIAGVAPLQDSYFPGAGASSVLRALARTPDGALLSAETLKDYQLHPGDLVRIRLQTGADRQYRPVSFHVVGEVKEFPSAPKDSFIIANSSYLTSVTGSDAVGTFLINSSSPSTTGAALRSSAAPGVSVADVVSARKSVTSASGLAATDLAGLSRLELGFGLVLALACSGLALALGINERRRALVLLAALGATAQQRGRFLAAEARGLLLGGLAGGTAIGLTIAYLLTKILTGIFDPAPTGLTVPAGYLAALVVTVMGVSTIVLLVMGRLAGRAGPAQLRDL